MGNKTEFIAAVHQKIRKKKQQRINTATIALSVCLVCGLILFQDYSFTTPDEIWAAVYDSVQLEVYKWEYMEEMTEEEIYLYLIDEQSDDEFIELANNSNDFFSALQSITWKEK